MKLQQNSLLALYSLVEFAAEPTRHISAAEIAHKYQVSPHHLAKVLAELARAGIVQSVRGVGGGYRFAANARRLTLLDVIARFEDVGSGSTDRNGRTPADRALSAVLGTRVSLEWTPQPAQSGTSTSSARWSSGSSRIHQPPGPPMPSSYGPPTRKVTPTSTPGWSLPMTSPAKCSRTKTSNGLSSFNERMT